MYDCRRCEKRENELFQEELKRREGSPYTGIRFILGFIVGPVCTLAFPKEVGILAIMVTMFSCYLLGKDG